MIALPRRLFEENDRCQALFKDGWLLVLFGRQPDSRGQPVIQPNRKEKFAKHFARANEF